MGSNLRTENGDILLFQQRLTVACAVLQAKSRLMLLPPRLSAAHQVDGLVLLPPLRLSRFSRIPLLWDIRARLQRGLAITPSPARPASSDGWPWQHGHPNNPQSRPTDTPIADRPCGWATPALLSAETGRARERV